MLNRISKRRVDFGRLVNRYIHMPAETLIDGLRLESANKPRFNPVASAARLRALVWQVRHEERFLGLPYPAKRLAVRNHFKL